jgi:hypothetical protein
LRRSPGGTRITLTGAGRAGGFFGLAEPLLRAAQRSQRTDLATLKRLLEGQPTTGHATSQHVDQSEPADPLVGLLPAALGLGD